MSAADAATTTASTKRYPAASGGKVGAAVTQLPSLAIMPLMPVSAETIATVEIGSPRTTYETFAFPESDNTNLDIVNGDLLIVAGVSYRIIAVDEWERPNDGSYLHLVVEKVKAS